jgi:hypothetical protein
MLGERSRVRTIAARLTSRRFRRPSGAWAPLTGGVRARRVERVKRMASEPWMKDGELRSPSTAMRRRWTPHIALRGGRSRRNSEDAASPRAPSQEPGAALNPSPECSVSPVAALELVPDVLQVAQADAVEDG